MLSLDVAAYVRSALGPAPLRVLEVGAGDGLLAAHLRGAGHDVVAIDPGPRAEDADGVLPIALADLDEPDGSFDAAVAVVALHHVEPLGPSLAHLAALLRPGAPLVVDEIDVDALDDRGARWWLGQRSALGVTDLPDAEHVVSGMHEHVHRLPDVLDALRERFDVGEPVPGPYMHRWYLPHSLRDTEVELIAAGELPAMGVRFVARRSGV